MGYKRTEIRDQRPEIRIQKSEFRGQMPETEIRYHYRFCFLFSDFWLKLPITHNLTMKLHGGIA